MRRLLILAVVPALIACTSDQPGIEGTGTGNQRDYAVTTFDRIEATGIDNVIVTVGGQPGVRAEGDAEGLSRLVIRVDGNRLVIGRRTDWGGSSGQAVTIRVTAPSLQAASLTGTGDMQISAVQAQRFQADVTGTGNLSIGALQGQEAQFRLTGTGDIQASGRVGRTELSITGTGTGNLAGLETETANIQLTGPGDASIKATRTADINIMGPGNVTVTGGGQCNVNRLGPGQARCS